MMSPAKRHRLKVLAEQQATAMTDDFGGYNKDASAYQLQLKELTNDKIRLKGIESIQTKIEEKRKLVPKYMPYVKGVIKADKPVDDLIVTTMMVWCIDTGFYHLALMIGKFVLKHNLKMSDNFSRSTASILVEELANAALETLKNDGDFDVGILNSVYVMTDTLDMHDQIRAKLYHAIGKLYLKMEKGQSAVEFLKMALAKNPKIAAKQELKSAEKLAAEQTEQTQQPAAEQSEQHDATLLLNPNGTPVVDDHGNQVQAS